MQDKSRIPILSKKARSELKKAEETPIFQYISHEEAKRRLLKKK